MCVIRNPYQVPRRIYLKPFTKPDWNWNPIFKWKWKGLVPSTWSVNCIWLDGNWVFINHTLYWLNGWPIYLLFSSVVELLNGANQDGTYEFSDFLEILQDGDVQRLYRAYSQDPITMDLHCADIGPWTTQNLSQEASVQLAKVMYST